MSAQDPVAGEVFSVRTIKTLTTNPAVQWANSYELQMGDLPSPAALVDAMNSIVNFEAALGLSDLLVRYATVSTWVPDSRPYNPSNFIRLDYNRSGERGLGVSTAQPLNVCLRVGFGTFFGRTGFRLYRRVLREEEVFSPSGTAAIQDNLTINNLVSGAIVDSGLNTLIESVAGTTRLVLKNATSVRPVTSVGNFAITIKKLNNKYFDRA